VLKTLGREDELKASGQLEQLQGSFARLDPPLVGIRREVGPLLLVRHFSAEIGIGAAVDRLVPQRGRHKLSAGEVVVALIASRLASPSPLYDVAGWASGAALQELFGVPHQLLNDDRLGRCLEALCPHADAQGAAHLPPQRRPRQALVGVVGLALLVFGLIESQLRKRLGQEQLTGLLPERSRGAPDRPQHPRRLPRPRPHLHRQRHPARPPHPHPTAHPQTARDRPPLAPARIVSRLKRGRWS
jgi:hypothetical protein